MNEREHEWFAPKRYGYGAGVPIRWQGWALTHRLCCFCASARRCCLRAELLVMVALLIPLTATLIVITARTTRGGWRWRWGDEE